MSLEALISRLKDKKVEIALDALGSQTDRGLYQCGREAGTVQGIEIAIEIINELLAEEKRRDPVSGDEDSTDESNGRRPSYWV